MLKVAVLAPDPIVRFGIKAFLEKSIENLLVSEFENLGHYQGQQVNSSYGLVFADLGIYTDKFRHIMELKASFSNSRLIVYDMGATFEDGIHYLKHGAQGFLPAISDIKVLLNCIETVLTVQFYLENVDVHLLLKLLFQQKGFKAVNTFRPKLTPRQNEVALLLANGASTTAISQKLGLQMSTVSTFKSIIYRKLNVDNIVELGSVLA